MIENNKAMHTLRMGLINGVKWEDKGGILTTSVSDMLEYLAAIEAVNGVFNIQFDTEVQKMKRRNLIPEDFRLAYVHRRTIWFRGHNSMKYLLRPSALRSLPDVSNPSLDADGFAQMYLLDDEMLHQFKENALMVSDNRLPYDASDMDWLALAQHYGMPTRMLDFTKNPLIALSFAIDGVDSQVSYVVVYCFDAAGYMLHFYHDYINDNGIESCDESIPTTATFYGRKYLEDSFKLGDYSYNLKEVPIPLDVLPYNRRLVAQSGAFLMWRRNLMSIEKNQDALPYFRRILIKNDTTLGNRIGEHLQRFGFTQSALYADLSAASHGLTTRLGLKIGRS